MATDKKSEYYDIGGIETLDILRAKLTGNQYLGFLMGNAMKYLARYNFKYKNETDKIREIEKAIVYLTKMKEWYDDNRN